MTNAQIFNQISKIRKLAIEIGGQLFKVEFTHDTYEDTIIIEEIDGHTEPEDIYSERFLNNLQEAIFQTLSDRHHEAKEERSSDDE